MGSATELEHSAEATRGAVARYHVRPFSRHAGESGWPLACTREGGD
jgi:hypothetical protein